MKTRIITLAAFLFLAIGVLSAKSLVLTLKNGTLVYYLLGGEANPMMRFVDGDIVVNTDKYEFGNIKNFYISATDDPSGIEHTVGENIQYAHNIMVVATDKPLAMAIYTSAGHKVSTPMARNRNAARVIILVFIGNNK